MANGLAKISQRPVGWRNSQVYAATPPRLLRPQKREWPRQEGTAMTEGRQKRQIEPNWDNRNDFNEKYRGAQAQPSSQIPETNRAMITIVITCMMP
jgi:hypothetical protein